MMSPCQKTLCCGEASRHVDVVSEGTLMSHEEERALFLHTDFQGHFVDLLTLPVCGVGASRVGVACTRAIAFETSCIENTKIALTIAIKLTECTIGGKLFSTACKRNHQEGEGEQDEVTDGHKVFLWMKKGGDVSKRI